jgi:hypothetical protein
VRRYCDADPQPGVNTEQTAKPLIVWPSYEPVGAVGEGYSVSLTEEDLVQHVFIIGSTGSGKTTLLTGAIQQLIRQPIGLLVLDAKQDGMVEQIAEMAGKAGRVKDLAILGPQGTHVMDLFGGLRTLDDVETLSQWLMLATDRIDLHNNPFWQNTTSALIAAALTHLVSRRRRTKFTEAVEFMRSWFVQIEGSAMPKAVTEVLEGAKRKAAKPGACPQLLGAVDHASVWKHLDPRTRSNLQSCLLNVLRPLLNSAATRSFDANDRPVFNPTQVATERKICVVSVNALTHPDLAKFFMRLARRQFFDAVQARLPGERPLTGLVADEFNLIVQGGAEDADQISTLRSKRCFILAATQGLSGLDDKIGARLRRSILLNFNSIVFMRTREQEVGDFATLSLGTREQGIISKPRPEWEDSGLALLARPSPSERQVPVCPPGKLGQLQTHQAYVIKSDGTRTLFPVWFVPWFEKAVRASENPTPGRKAKSVFDAEHIQCLMQRCGINPVLSHAVLNTALAIDAAIHQRALEQARDFFRVKACMIPEGLESLPASWLAGVPGILWAMRKRHWTRVPYMIRRVAFAEGVLLLEFAQEENRRSSRLTAWDQIRVVANRCVYPSRWRRLLRRHRLQLWVNHPELRSQLRAGELDFS